MERFLPEDLVEVRGMIGFFIVMEEVENSKHANLKLMHPENLREFEYPAELVEGHYRPVK